MSWHVPVASGRSPTTTMTHRSQPILFLLFLYLCIAQGEATAIFQSTCIDDVPTVPEDKTGCGVLAFMNQTVFGDNANSEGTLFATPRRNGLRIVMRLRKLSRPNLVLTAWLVYALPTDPTKPGIFNFAFVASPLAPTYAGFTSGLGREPNQFRYTSRTTARLEVNLDFNPTYAKEGPLGYASFCNQKDVPGIQGTQWRQPKMATTAIPFPDDVFVPAGSAYLRRYDAATGFEKLDSRGRPILVRSPIRVFAVAIAGHIDKTTHGIAPGIFSGDHFEVMSFVLNRRVGKPTQS